MSPPDNKNPKPKLSLPQIKLEIKLILTTSKSGLTDKELLADFKDMLHMYDLSFEDFGYTNSNLKIFFDKKCSDIMEKCDSKWIAIQSDKTAHITDLLQTQPLNSKIKSGKSSSIKVNPNNISNYVGTILVQNKFYGNIIYGKAGANIKEDCHVNIEISANKTNFSKFDKMIDVIGTKNNVKRAKNMITAIERSLAKHSIISVTIPKSRYKFLIGPNGANISILRDEFSVMIDFPDENSNSENVIISGEEEDTKKARDKLIALAKGCYTEQVVCAKENRSIIIGKKGANRIAFEKEFNVNLNIPISENKNIVILGTENNVKIAAKELNIRIQKRIQKGSMNQLKKSRAVKNRTKKKSRAQNLKRIFYY